MRRTQIKTTSIAWANAKAHRVTTADIRRLTDSGKMIRISPAQYGLRDEWHALTPDQRYLETIAHTWQRARSDSAVVSHLAAAALWGLPLLRDSERIVHLSGYKHPRGRSNEWARRHRVEVPPEDRDVRNGIPCTTLPRTVIDVALSESIETALICTDAAMRQFVEARLHKASARPHLLMADSDAARTEAEIFRNALRDRLERQAGRRGVRQARMVTELATWQSDSPGESLSRLRMHQVGTPMPELQVAVSGPGPFPYRVDFWFPELEVFGEFDGAAKYSTDTERAHQQLLAEKEREDWIRATTGWRCVRWRWKDIATQHAFATFASRTGLLTP